MLSWRSMYTARDLLIYTCLWFSQTLIYLFFWDIMRLSHSNDSQLRRITFFLTRYCQSSSLFLSLFSLLPTMSSSRNIWVLVKYTHLITSQLIALKTFDYVPTPNDICLYRHYSLSFILKLPLTWPITGMYFLALDLTSQQPCSHSWQRLAQGKVLLLKTWIYSTYFTSNHTTTTTI